MAKELSTDAIEVRLSRGDLGIACIAIAKDESTYPIFAESLSLPRAQREVTGYLIKQGYRPFGHWSVMLTAPDISGFSRRFVW